MVSGNERSDGTSQRFNSCRAFGKGLATLSSLEKLLNVFPENHLIARTKGVKGISGPSVDGLPIHAIPELLSGQASKVRIAVARRNVTLPTEGRKVKRKLLKRHEAVNDVNQKHEDQRQGNELRKSF